MTILRLNYINFRFYRFNRFLNYNSILPLLLIKYCWLKTVLFIADYLLKKVKHFIIYKLDNNLGKIEIFDIKRSLVI